MIQVPSGVQRILVCLLCFSLLPVHVAPPVFSATLPPALAAKVDDANQSPPVALAAFPVFPGPVEQTGAPFLPLQQAAATLIHITDTGFNPPTAAVFGPTDVTWINDTATTHTLRSGEPGQTGPAQIFLPLIQRGSRSAVEAAAVYLPYLYQQASSADFSATLAPGQSFTYRFTAPETYKFHLASAPTIKGELTLSGTALLRASPANGEGEVAVTRETVLEFSGALDPASVTAAAFTVRAGSATLAYRLNLSADKRRVTLFYTEFLPGSSRVRVSVDGNLLKDVQGGGVDVDGDGAAGGNAVLEFDTLSLTVVPGTAVCGRVFASELAVNASNVSVNTPLKDVTVAVDGLELQTKTDVNGNFCLNPAPAGRFFVHVDGHSATNNIPAGQYYPMVGKAWQSVPGQTTNVGDIYLPLVPPGTLQPVSAAQDTQITFPDAVLQAHPDLNGVSILVPADSLFSDDGARGGKVGIAPVPPDRLPGGLPEGLNFPVVITVQTDGGGNFDTPAPVCFPNLPDKTTGQPLPSGSKSALWSFDHDTGGWVIVGPMTVSADGKLVCTDAGVGIRAPGWHGTQPGNSGNGGPIESSDPDDGDGENSSNNDQNNDQNQETPTPTPTPDPDCKVTIQPVQETNICSGKPIIFHASGSPSPGTMTWSISGNGIPTTGTGTDFKVSLLNQSTRPANTTIIAHWMTEAGKSCSNQVSIDVTPSSGAQWVREFPTSTRIDDLATTFRQSVTNFVNALKNGGAVINISATFRPLKRAYLMHFSGKIGTGGMDPASVPQFDAGLVPSHDPYKGNIDICWTHFTEDGKIDYAKSRQSAKAMMSGYGIAYPAAYPTGRHMERQAIDMTITWNSDLTVRKPDGTNVTITSTPRTGNGNRELWSIGNLYEVYKLTNDPPHWSSDGRISDQNLGSSGDRKTEDVEFQNQSEGESVLQTGLHYFVLEDIKTQTIFQYGIAGSNGIAHDNLLLGANTRYREGILQAGTLMIGFSEFSTIGSGNNIQLPRILLLPDTSPDTDGDNLHDDAEFIMGTDPNNPDSDSDGLNDGAEVQNGTDPLTGLVVRTGIIGSADTPGTAVDICVENDLAVVADAEAGVAIFNVFDSTNPKLIAQVDTPGNAQRVACGNSRLAVADGDSGLAIVDISNAANARIVHQINLNGEVTAVASASNVAYAATAAGRIVAVDITTGAVLSEVTVPEGVQDLALQAEVLYALTTQKLYAIAFHGNTLTLAGFTDSPGQVGAGGRPWRLFVGGSLAYATHTQGYNTFDLTSPEQPALIKAGETQQFGWKQIISNGAGVGVAAVGPNSTDDGEHNISLYNVRDPQQTDAFITQFDTPGLAAAVTLYKGRAYVADSQAGMQVINYLAYDSQKSLPTITLVTNFAPGKAEEGALLRITANTTDDVQVRAVEFYIDGKLMTTDGNFPFEYRFITPRIADQASFKLRARAVDTGGNETWTEEQTITLVLDATQPQVIASTPRNHSFIQPDETTEISITFSEGLDVATVITQNIQVVEAGTDGRFGTADDQTRLPTISYDTSSSTITLVFGTALTEGRYSIVLSSAITDLAGNAIRPTGDGSGYDWQFRCGKPFGVDENVLALFNFADSRTDMVTDSSGNGRNATLIGGTYVEGQLGPGLRIGPDQPAGIDWDAYVDLLVPPYTIEMLLTPESTTGWYKLFGFNDNADGGWYYKDQGIQSYPYSVVGSGEVLPGLMHYLAFVSSEMGAVDIYYQGALLGSTNSGLTDVPFNAIFFRDDTNTGRREQVTAVVEALRISRIARSAEEIEETQAALIVGD